jgi:cytochrome c553
MSHFAHRIFTTILTLGLAFFTVSHVLADELDVARMLEAIDKRLSDKNAKQEAIEAGRDRALLCKYCHGKDGNSLKPDVPNLAGQNPRYLLQQIENFASRKRDDFTMSPLAANFSPEDKVNLAIFYYSQPVRTQPLDEARAAKGEALFRNVCSNCHGAGGHGNQKLARLAGQRAIYVENVLKAFRTNANDPAAKAESNRTSIAMENVAKNLTNEQIKAVAAYVAQLP